MSREIKFRAWDKFKDVPDMVYFDLDILQEGKTVLIGSIVDTELMQYTGLKDKNGTPIFEGDVVRENTEAFGKSDLHYIVGFDRGRFTLTEIGSGYDRLGIWNVNHNMEVIGNVFESPELLSSDNK